MTQSKVKTNKATLAKASMPQERSASHSTFVIDRVLTGPPSQVFAAFEQPGIKRRWFIGPDEWTTGPWTMDFKVGGREHEEGGPPGGPVHIFDATYQDIVRDRRIVFSYDMHLGAKRISVSLTTVELLPEGSGTHMIFTEQDVFLDGLDGGASREQGTRDLLDNLEKELRRQAN